MQVNNWDVTMDFFKANPVYLADPIFKEVKTKYKKEYSNILWFIALVNDPGNIKDKNLSKETKFLRYKYLLPEELLTKQRSYLDSLTINYLELCETRLHRMLRVWNETMDKKTKFLEESDYNAETYEMIEKILAGNVKAYKEWEEINKQLSKENEGKSLGGEEKSLADKGSLLG